jgi:hypothetical protein
MRHMTDTRLVPNVHANLVDHARTCDPRRTDRAHA